MIAHASKIKPKRRKTEFRQVADEVLRMVAAKWNIPADVIKPDDCNYASAVANSRTWSLPK